MMLMFKLTMQLNNISILKASSVSIKQNNSMGNLPINALITAGMILKYKESVSFRCMLQVLGKKKSLMTLTSYKPLAVRVQKLADNSNKSITQEFG